MNAVLNLRFHKMWEIFRLAEDCQLLGKDSPPWSYLVRYSISALRIYTSALSDNFCLLPIPKSSPRWFRFTSNPNTPLPHTARMTEGPLY